MQKCPHCECENPEPYQISIYDFTDCWGWPISVVTDALTGKRVAHARAFQGSKDFIAVPIDQDLCGCCDSPITVEESRHAA